MDTLSGLSKILFIIGLVFIFLSLLLFAFSKIPFLGKLPGDIIIQKKNFSFYFPITTSILISLVLSFIFYLLFRK